MKQHSEFTTQNQHDRLQQLRGCDLMYFLLCLQNLFSEAKDNIWPSFNSCFNKELFV